MISSPEVGTALRFATSDGRVLATSDIEALRWVDSHTIEVSTGNSCYQIELDGDAVGQESGTRSS